MKKKRRKLIVVSFHGKNGHDPHHQPSMDEPVGLPISPRIIEDCVLRDCDHEFSVHHDTQIESDDLCVLEELHACNQGNYVYLGFVGWSDNTYDENGERQYDSFGYVLEIHINGVFMLAKIGETFCTNYNAVLNEEVKRRAEDAFILASALIGVPVRRGLIVGEN